MTSGQSFTRGLRDVVAAESELCFIDGQAGHLIYRGYDIHDLARYSTYEETVFLLWNGRLPKPAELQEFSHQIAANRALPERLVEALQVVPAESNPMEMLRTAVSAMGHFDPDANKNPQEADYQRGLRLVAQMATVVAYLHRIRSRQPLVPPDPKHTHGVDFLTMLTGKVPDLEQARAFDTALVLHAEHGFAASTFAARVIISTASDVYSAIVGAIGALKGPLHGGANEAVFRMLQDIGDVRNVERHLEAMLARRERIPGFGHAVYKTMDPRAVHLRRFSQQLASRNGDTRWFDISVKLQEVVKQRLNLDPNVDFYSASVYHYLGIPVDLFTPVFAVSRIAGWVTNVLEQARDNRIIRPTSWYVGKTGLAYVPLEQR